MPKLSRWKFAARAVAIPAAFALLGALLWLRLSFGPDDDLVVETEIAFRVGERLADAPWGDPGPSLVLYLPDDSPQSRGRLDELARSSLPGRRRVIVVAADGSQSWDRLAGVILGHAPRPGERPPAVTLAIDAQGVIRALDVRAGRWRWLSAAALERMAGTVRRPPRSFAP